MKKQKKIDRLSDWEWTTLVAAVRAYSKDREEEFKEQEHEGGNK